MLVLVLAMVSWVVCVLEAFDDESESALSDELREVTDDKRDRVSSIALSLT